MSSERLQHNLSLLKPFNKLHEGVRGRINDNKRNFPDPSNELLRHLTVLGVPQLCDYLAWMPFERFTRVEILGRGGFATVWKGAVELDTEYGVFDQWYALKEVSPGQMAEVSSFLASLPLRPSFSFLIFLI